ncbi:MAG: hypothetical protein JRI91_03030 [Deltaproteobacteria bacterium]|nr:hypothetical protein [Deltaproteobacteria bacterium]
MDTAKRKKLEVKLRGMIELNDEPRVIKKKKHSKSNPAIVIRRRKDKQDQNITRKSNK